MNTGSVLKRGRVGGWRPRQPSFPTHGSGLRGSRSPETTAPALGTYRYPYGQAEPPSKASCKRWQWKDKS